MTWLEQVSGGHPRYGEGSKYVVSSFIFSREKIGWEEGSRKSVEMGFSEGCQGVLERSEELPESFFVGGRGRERMVAIEEACFLFFFCFFSPFILDSFSRTFSLFLTLLVSFFGSTKVVACWFKMETGREINELTQDSFFLSPQSPNRRSKKIQAVNLT